MTSIASQFRPLITCSAQFSRPRRSKNYGERTNGTKWRLHDFASHAAMPSKLSEDYSHLKSHDLPSILNTLNLILWLCTFFTRNSGAWQVGIRAEQLYLYSSNSCSMWQEDPEFGGWPDRPRAGSVKLLGTRTFCLSLVSGWTCGKWRNQAPPNADILHTEY